MARWRLTAAHYLNLDPSEEYSYEETDRNTGRMRWERRRDWIKRDYQAC